MGTWQIAANHFVGGVADGDRGMEKQCLLKTTVEGFHLSHIITKYLAAGITVIMDDTVLSVSPQSSFYYKKKKITYVSNELYKISHVYPFYSIIFVCFCKILNNSLFDLYTVLHVLTSRGLGVSAFLIALKRKKENYEFIHY